MSNINLFILGLFLVFSTLCKAEEKDSLSFYFEGSLVNNQIFVIYNQGHQYIGKDSAQATYYIDIANNWSHKLNSKEGVIRGQIEQAYLEFEYQQPHLAVETILNLLRSGPSLSIKDRVMIADILSLSMKRLGATTIAIDYRMEHSKLLKKLGDYKSYYYAVENIAYLYSFEKKYDSANYYYQLALQTAKLLDNKSMLMHCNNNMGYNLYDRGDFDKALIRYNKAIELYNGLPYPSQEDSLLLAIVLGNIGAIYSRSNEYNDSADFFERSVRLLKKLNNNGNKDSLHYGSFMIDYARLELNQGYFTSTEKKLVSAYTNIKYDTLRLMGYYEILASLYEQTGRNNQAMQVLQKLLEIKDQSTRHTYKANKDIHGLIQFQMDDVKKDYRLLTELMKRREEANTFKILLIAGASLFVFLIALILFSVYRSNQKKKRLVLDLEKQMTELELKNKSLENTRLEEELDYKNNDLMNFAIDITRKHDFIKELLNKMNQITHSNNLNEDFKNLLGYIRSELLIDNNLILFQENVDKVNHQFMSSLQESYPNLTLSELQICALLRLKLTTKEIATVKNVSAESVKVFRHRIRKKMGIKTEISLSKHLNSII